MNSISFREKQIAYRVEGEGEAILWLHGFCEDSRMWQEFASFLDDKKHIFIDLPGLGQSDVIPNVSIELMADVVEAVLQHLNIRQCVLIGHSMGGYVGLAFAKKYAGYLRGLCLFHSHPFADSETKIASRQKAIDFIGSRGHVLYIKQLIPALFEYSFVKSNRFLIEKMTMQAIEYSSKGITACLQAMLDRPDNSAVLEQIDCPVLFIVGAEDGVVPKEYSLEQLYLPDLANIHILPRVGHMGMFEATKKTQRIVNNFCSFCEETLVI